MGRSQGFTFIELLFVFSVMSALAIVLIPFILASQKQTYDTGARACAKSLQTVQSISQVDIQSYAFISADSAGINSSSDGIDMACKSENVFIRDRSNISTIGSTFTIDVWDRRGKKVITVTPSNIQTNAAGATPFSDDGSGGINLP